MSPKIRRRSASIAFGSTSLLLATVLLLPSVSIHAQHALVARAQGDWQARCITALSMIERGKHGRGVEILQRAIVDGDNALLRVPADFDGSIAELLEQLVSLRPEAAPAAPKKGEGAKKPVARGADSNRERARQQRAFRGFGGGRSNPTSWSRYRRVSDVARFFLSRTGEETRAVYRERYEPAASLLFLALESRAEGDDLERDSLEPIALRFPLTPSGQRARELLGDLELENAGFERAAFWFGGLLGELGTKLTSETKTASQENAALLLRLRTKMLLTVRLRGDERLYAHERSRVLAAIESDQERQAFAATLSEMETAALEKRAVSGLPGHGLPSYWGGELPGGNLASSPSLPKMPKAPFETSWQTLSWLRTVVVRGFYNEPPRDFGLRGFRGSSVSRWIDFPFEPLVDDNEVFLSGVFDLFRFDARPGTGKLLAQMSKPTPPGLNGRFKEASDSPIYATTLWRRDRDWTLESRDDGMLAGSRATGDPTPDSVIVTHSISTGVRRDHYMGYDITAEIMTRSLVAYDRVTGRRLWKTEDLRSVRRTDPFGPNQIPVEISYSSPPIVRGSRVYAGGWKQKGYINSVVRALDLRTGKTIWETAVGSSQMEQTMFGELAREPFASFLIEEGGVLYYQSNLGVIAALDARSGSVLWATTYDFMRPEPTLRRTPILRDLVWGTNSPLLLDHLLIVTPRDSQLLLAIDTGRGPDGASRAGEVLWYHDNSHETLRDFLGHHEGWLYFTGDNGVEALDISSRGVSGRLELAENKSEEEEASRGKLYRNLRPAADSGAAGSDSSSSVLPGREPLASLPLAPRVQSRYGGADKVVEAPGLLTDKGVLYNDTTGLYLVDHRLTRREPLVVPPVNAGVMGFIPGRVKIAGDLILVTSRLWITAYGSPVY
jgi:hypothetical protein